MISISIKAQNSSGRQYLTMDTEDGQHHLTLFGDYKGEPIQIDFDPLSDADVLDLMTLLRARIPRDGM